MNGNNSDTDPLQNSLRSRLNSYEVDCKLFEKVARPGRLELPTLCLEGRRSIQLSYGRTLESSNIHTTTRGL
jgi:hypothetical protein